VNLHTDDDKEKEEGVIIPLISEFIGICNEKIKGISKGLN
jgi:hypothetical protein